MSPVCKQINTEKRLVAFAGAALLVLIALYMYCVSATVMHVVVRQEMSQKISDMHSDIASLEAEYIAAQHAVSVRVASLPGFVETPEKVFIRKSDTALVIRDTLVP